LIVIFWIVAILLMALAWSGLSLKDVIFGRHASTVDTTGMNVQLERFHSPFARIHSAFPFRTSLIVIISEDLYRPSSACDIIACEDYHPQAWKLPVSLAAIL